jgi:hypothetical protein
VQLQRQQQQQQQQEQEQEQEQRQLRVATKSTRKAAQEEGRGYHPATAGGLNVQYT